MKNQELLRSAARHWEAMERFRRERRRCKRYCYGDQWSDMINTDEGRKRESEYIEDSGAVPLKNNLIRRLVRSVMGVYQSQRLELGYEAQDAGDSATAERLNDLLQGVAKRNSLDELYTRGLEEFLISGLVVQRKWCGRRDGILDCWTENVAPDTFFVDTSTRDYRGWDVTMVGELHDLPAEELFARFAHSPEECRHLGALYAQAPGAWGIAEGDFGYDNHPQDFYTPNAPGLCRVIEVWRREPHEYYRCHDPLRGVMYEIPAKEMEGVKSENNRRRRESLPEIRLKWEVRPLWRYYYLTPYGDVLAEGDTPYAHGSHPFVYKAYPFLDGEIHSFVSDVIDQQRYTNRLITLYDWIMRASAKGVLMVPEDCLGRTTPEEFAEQWTKFNGVIFYRPRAGTPPPQQISINSTNIGITELLGIQLKFFEDISGVSPSLQGKPAVSGMSGTLYHEQTQNATMSLMDLLETYTKFVRAATEMDISNLRQLHGRQ